MTIFRTRQIGGVGSGGASGVDSTARTATTSNAAALTNLTSEVIDAPNIVTDDAAKTISFPLKGGGAPKVVDLAAMLAGLSGVPENAAQTAYDNATSALAAGNVQAALDELAAAVTLAEGAIATEEAARIAADALMIPKTDLASDPDRTNPASTKVAKIEDVHALLNAGAPVVDEATGSEIAGLTATTRIIRDVDGNLDLQIIPTAGVASA